MSEFSDEDEYLVRVRAQVMMRDDSTGGWVPLGGGGLSLVAVRRRQLVDLDCGGLCQYEYLIIGRRISDEHDVLSCTIKRDFQYNRVMPTFHHWMTGNKKFGLTFQTAADARTFHKGISNAVDDLLNGEPTESTPLQRNMDVGEGDAVFMELDLPLERDSSHPSTPNTRSPCPNSASPPVRSPLTPPPRSPLSPAGLSSVDPCRSPMSGCSMSPPPPPVSRLTPTLSHSLSSPLNNRGDTPLLNQLETQRLLTQRSSRGSNSRSGALPATPAATASAQSANAAAIGRAGSVRSSGLPVGDPPPPGDNIYEWLHNSDGRAAGPAVAPSVTVGPLRTMTGSGSDKFEKYNSVIGGEGPLKDSSYSYSSDAYVRFEIKEQDPQYHYPNLDSLANVIPVSNKTIRPSSAATLKPQAVGLGLEDTFTLPPAKDKMPSKGGGGSGVGGVVVGKKGKKGKKSCGLRAHQERCAHCQELYTENENKKGVCSYSPDTIRQGIDCVSCLSCAKCLLYHCHYEDENFSEEEICTCTDTDGHLAKRWLGLSLLAVLVPCLCLYPVLTACYSCGRACHVCGGKHVPV